MLKEIGSEFMADSYQKGVNRYRILCDRQFRRRYVLSGRTGLYMIAQELLAQGIADVALPAYCCASMVAPFVRAGVRVQFYEETVPCDAKAVLVMDYFGYLREETVAFAQACKEQGKIVIVDATQTAFSRSETYDLADYVVVSYRKWFDCLCAEVYSKQEFLTPEFVLQEGRFTNYWRSAARLKRVYCVTGEGDKARFLAMYRIANEQLAKDYIGYGAGGGEVQCLWMVDSDDLRNRRRANAQYLIDALRGKVELLFDEMGPEDCPLHVPILVPAALRDGLRQALTEQAVYCPAHWPIDPNYPHKKTALHDTEISLVCDQRYSLSDMERQAAIVIRFMTEERGA